MLQTILEDNELISHKEFDNIFKVDINKSPIKLEGFDDIFPTFLAIIYLSLLKKIVKKGLRKEILLKESVLKNKYKGKVKLKDTIQQLWLKGKQHIIISSLPLISEDNLENQILKAAFIKVVEYLKYQNFKHLDGIIAPINKAFETVSTKFIERIDFLKVKNSALFPEYRNALTLAKAIHG